MGFSSQHADSKTSMPSHDRAHIEPVSKEYGAADWQCFCMIASYGVNAKERDKSKHESRQHRLTEGS